MGTGPLLLRPMLAIGDRLRTGMRLALLVVVLLIPGAVATAMYTKVRGDEISVATSERDGADAVRPMLLALADTVAGTTPDLGAVRTAAADRPALELTALVAKLPALGDGAPAQRYALAEALAELIDEAGDNSHLLLEPELDSYHLVDITLGQIPAALLAGSQATVPMTGATRRQLVAAHAVFAGSLTAAAGKTGTDLDTAVANTAMAGMRSRLTPVPAFQDAAAALATTITADLAYTSGVDPAALGVAARAAVTALDNVLVDLLDQRIQNDQHEWALVLAIAIGGFVLAGWFAIGVVRRTTHDVRRTVSAVSAIAEGDLGVRELPTGRDEMGDIGRALAVARARLDEQDTAIRHAAEAREQQLRASFLHQRQVEAQFRKRAQTVIDDSTGVIAEELRRVTDQVGHVRDGAGIIDASISTTDAATAAVVAQARQAEQVINSLEQSLRRVATTAALVTGIAGQTRLLALNATIEAARAGELGEGFTVVADEVKELATNTARSTEQIAETINDLERDTQAMAHTITTMIEGIASVGDAADSLRAVTTDQDNLVNELSGQMHDTLSRVEQMSNLAAALERRQHDRIAAAGETALSIAGRPPVPVTTVNISAGGLRCAVPPALTLREGDTVSVDLRHGADHVSVHATVMNSAPGDNDDEREIGLQFMITDPALEQRLSAYVQGVLDNAVSR
jgi:methyl-accepting chemotaxis protein